jgi:hypothetical protein
MNGSQVTLTLSIRILISMLSRTFQPTGKVSQCGGRVIKVIGETLPSVPIATSKGNGRTRCAQLGNSAQSDVDKCTGVKRYIIGSFVQTIAHLPTSKKVDVQPAYYSIM